MIAAVKGEYSGTNNRDADTLEIIRVFYFLLLMPGLVLIGVYCRRYRLLAVGLGGVYAPLLAGMVFTGVFSRATLVLLIPLGMLGAFVSVISKFVISKFDKWFAEADNSGSDSDGGASGWGRSGGFSGGSDFSGGGGSSGGGGASGGW
jgi:uncharacterized protein